MVEQDEKPKPGDIVSLTTDDNRLVIKSLFAPATPTTVRTLGPEPYAQLRVA